MRTLDDVMDGDRAEEWTKEVGPFGDPIRMALVNDVVARTLDYFRSLPSKERIARPHRVLQQALSNLPVSSSERMLDQLPELEKWHADSTIIAERYPRLAGASLLDLGCGNAYLGGWLAQHGVDYVGVEPSERLLKHAQGDERLSKSTLIQRTIRQFCEEDALPDRAPPTLISIIAVLDHLADREATLRSLFEFMQRRSWLNVPVLAASFDPDFFAPGLPTSSLLKVHSDSYGVGEDLEVLDPAEWEEIFSVTGFHLLEQRPVHISALPGSVADHLETRHREIFTQCQFRVPPRQGPFFYWLMCPRLMRLGERETQSLSGSVGITTEVETYPEDEALEVLGNLGARLYRLKSGEAFFDSPDTKRMTFKPGDYFGQLETSGNYVSSRILGGLRAASGSAMETSRNRDVLRHISVSDHLADKIFLSMLRHFDAVRFVPFVSPKRKKQDQNSKVFSGTTHDRRDVRNFAACLLHACATVVPDPLSERFRSRIVVELTDDDVRRFVHGPQAYRENDVFKVGPSFVQAHVIDSFSPHWLLENKQQQKIRNLADERKGCHNPLHLGWLTACYLEFHFPAADAEGTGQDVLLLATAIGAYLGFEDDINDFKKDFQDRIALEDELPDDPGAPKMSRRLPKTAQTIRDYIIEHIICCEDSEGTRKLHLFFMSLLNGLRFHKPGEYYHASGMSDLIVLRDIRALVACVLDEPKLWGWAEGVQGVGLYMAQDAQRPRLVAYYQECIAYMGAKAGFESSPW